MSKVRYVKTLDELVYLVNMLVPMQDKLQEMIALKQQRKIGAMSDWTELEALFAGAIDRINEVRHKRTPYSSEVTSANS